MNGNNGEPAALSTGSRRKQIQPMKGYAASVAEARPCTEHIRLQHKNQTIGQPRMYTSGVTEEAQYLTVEGEGVGSGGAPLTWVTL